MVQVITIYFNGNSRKTYDYLLVNKNNKVKVTKNKGFFLTTQKGVSGIFVVDVKNVGYIPDRVYTIFEVVDNKNAKTAPLSPTLRDNYNTALRKENSERYKYQSKQMLIDLNRLPVVEKAIITYTVELKTLNDRTTLCKKYDMSYQLYKNKIIQKKAKIKALKQEVREIKQRLELYK